MQKPLFTVISYDAQEHRISRPETDNPDLMLSDLFSTEYFERMASRNCYLQRSGGGEIQYFGPLSEVPKMKVGVLYRALIDLNSDVCDGSGGIIQLNWYPKGTVPEKAKPFSVPNTQKQ